MNSYDTVRVLVGTFVALVLLTGLTVGVSFLALGHWHLPVGLAIATAKALLIGLFFMHLVSSPRIMWLCVLAGLCWFSILVALTMTDYVSRGWPVH